MTGNLTDQDLLNLTAEQTREIYAQGPEAVTWALLKLSLLAQEKQKPSAASSTAEETSEIERKRPWFQFDSSAKATWV